MVGAMSDNLMLRPAVELAAMIASGELSPVELVDACLAEIDRRNAPLNALVTVDEEGARAAARAAADQVGKGDLPPFHGVPLAVKDLHFTAGLRTTFGTKLLADQVPEVDEEHVARLRAAGYIFVAKTNVPEFGSLPFTESALLGECRNPWDLGRNAGGSSGGSAAALSAGMVPAATGSDGGGSCRIPAANCAVFGFKPSRGRVSNAPLFGDVAGGLSTPGPLSHHVVDAAAMLDAMSGYATGDPHWAPDPVRPFLQEAQTDPQPLRVALVTTSPLGTFSPDTIRAAEEAGRLFESLGHHVEPLTVTGIDEQFRVHFETLWSASIGSLPIPAEALEPFNAQLAERGARQSAAELMQAMMGLQLGARLIVGATADYDVVLSPTLMREPLRIGELSHLLEDADAMFDALTAYLGLTPVANVTGQPSMSLPIGFTAEGLPLGVMVTGRPADEAMLFRLAGQVQRADDWTQRRPPETP